MEELVKSHEREGWERAINGEESVSCWSLQSSWRVNVETQSSPYIWITLKSNY